MIGGVDGTDVHLDAGNALPRADLAAGATAVSPVLPAGATVGLVTGVAATTVGLSPLQAAAMSIVVYSPTVMLTAFALLESGAPLVVVVFASLVVAARFVLLSASISSHFAGVPTRWKWLLAYLLWTPVYALSMERFEARPTTDRRAYYLGAALPLWATFQGAVLAGISFGAGVPSRWQLGFVVPLAFIALLTRFLTDRSTKVAALVAGGLAVAGGGLPLNTGIVVAALGGTAAGIALDREGTEQ